MDGHRIIAKVVSAIVVAVALLAVGIVYVSRASGQASAPRRAVTRAELVPNSVTVPQSVIRRPGSGVFGHLPGVGGSVMRTSTRARTASADTFEAVKELNAAKSDEEKESATEKLRAALDKEYDASLEDYESSVEEMEKRLESLREELVRRRDARDDIVELRLQTLLNEADGLGWPNAQTQPTSRFKARTTYSPPPAEPVVPRAPRTPTELVPPSPIPVLSPRR